MSEVNHNASFTKLIETYRARRTLLVESNIEFFIAQNLLIVLPEDHTIGETICTEIGTDSVLIALLPGDTLELIYFTEPNICWISQGIRKRYTDDDLRKKLATDGVHLDIVFSEFRVNWVRDRSLMKLIDQNTARCVQQVNSANVFSTIELGELQLELAGHVVERTEAKTILVLPISGVYCAFFADTSSIWVYPAGPIPPDVIDTIMDRVAPIVDISRMKARTTNPFVEFHIPVPDEELVNIEPDTEADEQVATSDTEIDSVHDRIFNSGVTFMQGLDMLAGAMSRDPQVANLLRTRLVTK